MAAGAAAKFELAKLTESHPPTPFIKSVLVAACTVSDYIYRESDIDVDNLEGAMALLLIWSSAPEKKWADT